MKVMIAAGGTGGHIYPGIAVAKEICGATVVRGPVCRYITRT